MNYSPDLTLSVVAAAFLLAVGLLGGILPQYITLSDRGLHRILALGTGMLLGTIFYHMLPESLTGGLSSTFVLIGLLGVFVVERVIFAGQDHHHSGISDEDLHQEPDHASGLNNIHALIGVTAFAGLSVHALMVGLGMSAQLNHSIAAGSLLTSLIVHKFSEAFSLSTIFLLAGYKRERAIVMMLIFACIEPFGVIIGSLAMGYIPRGWDGPISGLATGTFLYVALSDLLPEVFHRREGRWASLTALLLGIALIGLLIALGGEH